MRIMQRRKIFPYLLLCLRDTCAEYENIVAVAVIVVVVIVVRLPLSIPISVVNIITKKEKKKR